MWRLEKLYVNRTLKGRWSARRFRRRLESLDLAGVHDVLEVGCGRGHVAAELARTRDVSVLAVDVDPDQIALARRTHPEHDRLRFAVEDAGALRLPDASVDLVVCQHVFHHLPEWPRAAAEIARVLRPGGHVVWLDLALPEWVRGWLAPLAGRVAGVFTFPEVAREFAAAGLETRKHRSFRVGPLPHHDLLLRRE